MAENSFNLKNGYVFSATYTLQNIIAEKKENARYFTKNEENMGGWGEISLIKVGAFALLLLRRYRTLDTGIRRFISYSLDASQESTRETRGKEPMGSSPDSSFWFSEGIFLPARLRVRRREL